MKNCLKTLRVCAALAALLMSLEMCGLPAHGQKNVQTKTGVQTDQLFALAYSPDGKLIAGGTADGRVKLWDAQDGALLRELHGLKWYVRAVAFTPDGKTLMAGSDDGDIRLFDAQTGDLKRTLRGDGAMITSAAVSPDGKTIASTTYGADEGGKVRTEMKLWDIRTGEQKRTTPYSVRSIAFSPDGKTLAGAGKELRLWDVGSGKLLRTLKIEGGSFHSVAFSPDGKSLASIGGYVVPAGQGTRTLSEAHLWDVRTGELRRKLTELHPWPRAIAFAPDGKTLATGTGGPGRRDRGGAWATSELKMWDVATGQALHTIEGPPGMVNALAFAPDGKSVVFADDEVVEVIDTGTGQRQRTLMTVTKKPLSP